MCAILTFADGTTVESCGELREKGYIVPVEYVTWTDEETGATRDADLADDDCCLCNIDLAGVLRQQPRRQWRWDPFGFTEVVL